MAASRQIFTLAFGAFMLASPAFTAGTVINSLTDPDNPNLPADATPKNCYAREFVPAVIETVTQKILLTPERRAVDLETGETTVIRPATYDTKVVQRIVRERKETWFETICPQIYTERFVKSLQRALKARGFYAGPLTGWMDPETNVAIRLYQRQARINSEILSLSTAEDFGLIAHRDFKRFNSQD